MTSLLEALKSIRPWQIAVLVGIVVVAAVGGYVGYSRLTAEESTDLGEDQRLVAVRRGDFVNEVSVSGSLEYKDRDSLSFGTAGTVAEVAVEAGQRVRAGDVLARLDSETIAELERAAVQAEGKLRDAEDSLAEARHPYSALDLARAQADVADALIAKRSAEDELAEMQTSDAQAVARAGAAVADALIAKRAAEDALAELQTADPQAIAKARTAVSDALITRRAAEDALAELTPSARQMAEAEKEVAMDEEAVRNAEESLADLLSPPADLLARAQNTVTTAKRTLQDAQDSLAELLEPSDGSVAAAEAAVTRAKEELEDASIALDELLAGPDEDLLAQAMSDLDSARASLNEALVDRTLAGNDWDDRLETAHDAVTAGSEQYATVFSGWLGSAPTGDELTMDPGAILESWGADIETLFSPTSRSIRPDVYFARGSGDDPETRWDEGVIYFWMHFYPQDIVVTCDDEEPARTLCIMRELDDAWSSLRAARDNLATLQLEAEKALSQRNTAVRRAEETVADAEQRVVDLQEEPDPLAVEAAKARYDTATHALQDAQTARSELLSPPSLKMEEQRSQLDVAAAALDVAEADLADLTPGPNDSRVVAARAQLVVARADLQDAESDLADLRAGPNEIDLEAAQAQVGLATANLESAEADLAALTSPDQADVDAARAKAELAAANLESAEADLAELLAGPDPMDVDASRKKVELATASVDHLSEKLAEIETGAAPLVVSLREGDVAAAKSALDAGHQQLAESVITAPWNGIVTSVRIEEGEEVSLGVAAIAMVDPTVVQVAGTIDEIDVLFVRMGAETSVSMDAFPGQSLSGTVTDIGTQATNQQGVVSYPITVEIQTQGLEFPEGMSAVASVVITEERNVLLVPIDALFGTFDQPELQVMKDGWLESRGIVLGNTDEFWAVVESGANEGEMVVLETRDSSFQSGFGAIFRGVSSGFRRPTTGGGGGQR